MAEPEAAFILPATDKKHTTGRIQWKTAKVIKVCCTFGSYFQLHSLYLIRG